MLLGPHSFASCGFFWLSLQVHGGDGGPTIDQNGNAERVLAAMQKKLERGIARIAKDINSHRSPATQQDHA